jgi:hypothetical protein
MALMFKLTLFSQIEIGLLTAVSKSSFSYQFCIGKGGCGSPVTGCCALRWQYILGPFFVDLLYDFHDVLKLILIFNV